MMQAGEPIGGASNIKLSADQLIASPQTDHFDGQLITRVDIENDALHRISRGVRQQDQANRDATTAHCWKETMSARCPHFRNGMSARSLVSRRYRPPQITTPKMNWATKASPTRRCV